MHPALHQQAHRPWPIPAKPWTWRQNWIELLFAHYPIAQSIAQKLVPPSLQVQEFDGTSWIGVVPFRMTGVMRRPLPDLPGLSAFPELNVRLYVERDGKPGVWFLSLDASNRIAVWAARRFFHLPYYHATMTHTANQGGFDYTSKRTTKNAPNAAFTARYRPASDVRLSRRGTLESFLTERYCLYAQSPDNRLFRCEVQHAPWPLQDAHAEIDPTQLLDTHGISVEKDRPLLHYSSGVQVVVWSLEDLGIRANANHTR